MEKYRHRRKNIKRFTAGFTILDNIFKWFTKKTLSTQEYPLKYKIHKFLLFIKFEILEIIVAIVLILSLLQISLKRVPVVKLLQRLEVRCLLNYNIQFCFGTHFYRFGEDSKICQQPFHTCVRTHFRQAVKMQLEKEQCQFCFLRGKILYVKHPVTGVLRN